MSRKLIRCPNCKFEGPVERRIKGNIIIEIALWLLLLVPGIIYTLWRSTSRYDACPACGWAHVVQIQASGDALARQDIQSDYKELIFVLLFFGVGLGVIAVYWVE